MGTSAKYFISGNLSEKQIEADVASFLGWCTPDGVAPFRLLDVDEQKTGADKLFDRGLAIYVQFKKSTGLHSTRKVKPSVRKNRSPLEDIREFRARSKLQDDPSLFFQLRAKAANAEDLQHNVLLSYNQPPVMRAIYVAPLTLDKSAYSAALHNSVSGRYFIDPWWYEIRTAVHAHRWVSHFGAVPFLREHVSIPPHERVQDHNHYFAYSEVGTDISWHSPNVIGREPSRLSDFMVSTFRHALSSPDSLLPIEGIATRSIEVGQKLGYPVDRARNVDSPLAAFGSHGAWLRETYEIRQFILLASSELLARIANS